MCVRACVPECVLFFSVAGDTFQCVFGANQSPLEALLLERKIKGPSWIDVKNPREFVTFALLM